MIGGIAAGLGAVQFLTIIVSYFLGKKMVNNDSYGYYDPTPSAPFYEES